MGFEDYMRDAGFADEQDYMDYLEGEYCNDNSFDFQEEINKDESKYTPDKLLFKELNGIKINEHKNEYSTDIPGRFIPAPLGSKLVCIETLLPILEDYDKERLDVLFEKSYNPNLVNKKWITWLPDIEIYDNKVFKMKDIKLNRNSEAFNESRSYTHTYFRKKWLRFYGDINGDENDFLSLSMWKGYHTSASFSSLESIFFVLRNMNQKLLFLGMSV